FASIYIADVDGALHQVTSEYFESREPVWDPDGNYMYFLSDHEYGPIVSTREYDFATTRQTGIFAMALRKDVKHPFPPESDEVSIQKDSDAAKDSKKDEKKDDKSQDLKIDFDGID